MTVGSRPQLAAKSLHDHAHSSSTPYQLYRNSSLIGFNDIELSTGAKNNWTPFGDLPRIAAIVTTQRAANQKSPLNSARAEMVT
jgi:hypothetical protein